METIENTYFRGLQQRCRDLDISPCSYKGINTSILEEKHIKPEKGNGIWLDYLRTNKDEEEETVLIDDAPILLKGSKYYESSSILPLRESTYYGKKEKKLGEGSYGNVYLYMKNDISYAVKEFSPVIDGIESSVLREVSILIRCRHENIVPVIDVIEEYPRYYMIMPLADGNLTKFIQMRLLDDFDKFGKITIS